MGLLSPCPFCGEKKNLGQCLCGDDLVVVCGACHGSGPLGSNPGGAAAAWNRRITHWDEFARGHTAGKTVIWGVWDYDTSAWCTLTGGVVFYTALPGVANAQHLAWKAHTPSRKLEVRIMECNG